MDGARVGSVVGSEVDGAGVGSGVGSEVDGDVVGPRVGSEVDGARVGPGLGSEVDGDGDGSGVGSAVVGFGVVGDPVGLEVVGDVVGDVVVDAVGNVVGTAVGYRVVCGRWRQKHCESRLVTSKTAGHILHVLPENWYVVHLSGFSRHATAQSASELLRCTSAGKGGSTYGTRVRQHPTRPPVSTKLPWVMVSA